MRRARIMGNYVQQLAIKQGITEKNLAETLGCTEFDILKLYKGFVYPSFSQVSKLAVKLNVSIDNLLNGDIGVYGKTVVHCMNDFENDENREQILDIIETYVDVFDSVFNDA